MENTNDHARRVIDYYILCNKLKTTLRSGWVKWGADAERIESIAEHIYGTQQLAIAIYLEYGYDLDFAKIILMLAVHELEEVEIGDIIPFEDAALTKAERGHRAIHEILSGLCNSEYIEKLILEFDAHETPEAQFAYLCDKLEACLQCKFYDESGCFDMEQQKDNPLFQTRFAQEYANQPDVTLPEIWLNYWDKLLSTDPNFSAVNQYALKNSIK